MDDEFGGKKLFDVPEELGEWEIKLVTTCYVDANIIHRTRL